MYDDYDLDYTYAPQYEYDLDEIYDSWIQSRSSSQVNLDEDLELDQDDDYARDTLDYDALAYRHYAWYNTCTHALDTCLHTQSVPSVLHLM